MYQVALNRFDFKRKLLACLFGSIAIALGSQISIQNPVPTTMQTLAVLWIASAFGPKLGTQSVVVYLLEGACGVPVFSGYSAGVHVIFGPTGGYLLGFVPAVYLTGRLLQKSLANNGFWRIFLAGMAGECMIFLFGYWQLSCFFGFAEAYTLGVAPFFIPELLKLSIFSLLVVKNQRFRQGIS
ncbi:MAG: biotin transporter BioY [Holosporaceae bacterium]|nr:biotin transporter BioY [Holosporaceae bacterium]